jgi:hypothetical protein
VPRVVALIAAAIILMAGSVRFAAAGLTYGTTSCCCGPHASDHRCGCPDCPTADQAHGDDDHDGDRPVLGKCGVNGMVLAPAAVSPTILAHAPTVATPVRPVAVVTTTPPPPLQTGPRGPEPPPPR